MKKEFLLYGSLVVIIIALIAVIVLKLEKFQSDINDEHATYRQAYLEPTKMLQLPPLQHLHKASSQPLNDSGIPKSMFKGSEKNEMNFTSDMKWCH